MRKALNKVKSVSGKRLQRRKLSIRVKVSGTALRPRISLTKSNKNFFVQLIDDDASKTLFSLQTFGKNAPQGAVKSSEGVKILGKAFAGKMKEHKILTAVFDRSGKKYTGLIASFVDSVREEGIKI